MSDLALDLALIQITLIGAVVVVLGSVTYIVFEDILIGIPKKQEVKVKKGRKGGSSGR
ncbi:hypothetical protein GWK48_05240 [Metallosphaera tengchongensis]|uniref:Uncharacterized protein n=1 Tax=Metallosphaera tengchongensis TaxID=1532350 RepID=A0A6N0NT09_9CREN|nr:hypothetical protein [Metallosphaera tengchongensis]QKQ98988.1 hypothetical protein GWK48_05240 [Metallosphaera tengchongensis]